MRRNGFTLIEILFATMILATGLFSLMVGLGNCAQMMALSKEYQDAQFVFSLGERCYPIPPNDEVTDPEEDERLNIDPVRAEEMIDDLQMEVSREMRETYKDFTFERAVEEKELETNEEDDGLYVLRTRITWGSGKEGYYEELVRLIRKGK
ncbi:MAG: prepilin-type N-terminal cleavage/methylation domain-containing protein [Kiritimatiellia bacterium]|jgi:prepilin-type N-terminal cleavage/methylation domain-containing protein|nr:prepilin-type N-terminal cleavage/methylation domain-containing protein [Kiritimatiellia bacterium]MDX9792072.1 prepilin-type N-terminal cleavage/methylation domain-containing protein [Kiritimatiellia bacterium]NLC80210.1 prepilin-type N-terminal cleavage/methylation domain-containing protein [Lentisphaerota bacterium]